MFIETSTNSHFCLHFNGAFTVWIFNHKPTLFSIKSLRMQEKSIQFTTSNSKVISPGIPECGEQYVFKIQSKKSHWVWPWTSSQQRLSRKASLCWFYLVKFVLPFNVCKRFRLSGRVKFVARGSVLEIVFLSCRN